MGDFGSTSKNTENTMKFSQMVLEKKAYGAVKDLISFLGDNPEREGLIDTPDRVLRSYSELFSGYKQNPEDILSKCFIDGACNELIVVKDVEFFSFCEHHMLPFYGKVDFGYIPDGKVIGISKIARLIEVFARRLQIQERMTTQIADSFNEIIKPKGVMVITEATHFCMIARGIQKQHSKMITSAMRGDFNEAELRNEFLNLVNRRD